jgi:hypothetical protein
VRRVLLAVLLVVLLPAGTRAATVIYDTGAPALALQGWIDASYVPVAPVLVIVHLGACYDGGRTCTYPGSPWIWLNEPPNEMRVAFAHELGHVFDYFVLTDANRLTFRRLVGDTRPWRSTGGNSPHEKFAEAYGLCFRHLTIGARHYEDYDYNPTPDLHRRVCSLIRRAGAQRVRTP